ncbi:periplasmic binding protein-like II [Anaeromyces robustus]|uniref:Periplasmic binding protein-like II n=1 Tax=Anaeromyces robustus TaxID=1754192 RepID=A0A1Y1XL29_9FUNG|nr:periplasmic binding protein-like II [Anaeromyces robustus]|eukprot:ORX86176.1 periplasmic binding protein-like II [Anaeromyces robustus]
MRKIYDILTSIVKSINIKAISIDVSDDGVVSTLVNDFNDYSIKNNLNITLDLTLFTSKNSTVHTTGDTITIQSLLENKSRKYDLYIYTFPYAPQFSEHLLDLNNYISKDIINLYDSEIFRETNIINNRLIGFPINRSFTVLYSNKKLLKDYNKSIPKTWEELLNTTNYILEEERNKGHTSLLGLTGLFGDDSGGSVTISEMLGSYRKTISSDYPDLTSQEAVDALEMYKKLLTVASSGYESIFKTIYIGDSIFIKYWNYEDLYPLYEISELPGWKEGISVSNIGGLDIGITKYTDKENILASIKVLEFMFSKEEQKEMILKKKIYTGIKDLYDDDDVCSIVKCNFYKNLQLFPYYNFNRKDYTEYSSKIRKYVYEFTNGNKTASEVLNDMNNLSSICQIKLNGENSSYGIILFILTLMVSLIIIGTFLILTIERFKPFFQFLPMDFWYIILLGILCHTVLNFTDYGEILSYKCTIQMFLYYIGFTLTFTPFLYKLIENLPEQYQNDYTKKITKNRYILLVILILCDILFTLIKIGSSDNVTIVIAGNGKIYQQCKLNGFSSIVIAHINIGIKALIFLGIGFISFLEWNTNEIKNDIHMSISTLYINIISIIMIAILKFFKFDNYIIYCILSKMFNFCLVISNYIAFFGIRIVLGFIRRNDIPPVKQVE